MISLIIPTLNEAGSIGAVLDAVPRGLVDEVIVIDGFSTDDTAQIAYARGARVLYQYHRGYGDAIQLGIMRALGDIIVLADADGSYNLLDIAPLVACLDEGADIALGSRYWPESGSADDTWVRWLGNQFFTRLLRWRHGLAITDALFFFCAFRRSTAKAITDGGMPEGFEYIPEFLIRAHRLWLMFAEIPSAEKARTAGRSKVRAVRDGWRVLRCIMRRRR